MIKAMTAEPDDDLLFITDLPEANSPALMPSWRILVVDDDPEVHQVTRLVLKRAVILGRTLELVDAFSMEESKSILRKGINFAVILLDVVMETPDAGLQLISYIRDELHMSTTRIILRTGQPGYAPELDVFARYDINDYHAKTELTHARLITAMTSALRAYQQIQENMEGRDLVARIAHVSAMLSEHHALVDMATRTLLCLVDIFRTTVSGLFATQNMSLGPEHSLHAAEDDSTNVDADSAELDLRVIAATGRFGPSLHQSLDQLPESDRELLHRCLREAHSLIDGNKAVVYIYGDFSIAVVLVEFMAPIEPIQWQALELFSANLGSAYASARIFEKLRVTSDEDLLTHLSNRRRFIRLIDEMIVSGVEHYCLALIDINHFADLNDGLGQDVGDGLLRAVAKRLKEGLPECAVARVGGDVFAVAGPDTSVNYVELADLFKLPFQADDNLIPLTVTFGLCRFEDTENSGIDLLKSTNIALNRAKKSMVVHFEYFKPDMAENTRWRLKVIRELRRDFDLRKLDVWFQPQINLSTGEVHGMEALVRWPDEQGGFVHPPGVFIPLAEYSGLIVDIGRWVLEKSADTLLLLQNEGISPGRVAVNVSMPQFRSAHFVDEVEALIRSTGVDPSSIELEITESIAMDEPKDVQQSFHRLKDIGTRIAIDDFGTGYSSMGHLRALPIDAIKVDQMFVKEIAQGKGGMFVETIIALSKRLGVETIAEGVETEEQAFFLRNLGCNDAQGWLYAKAMPLNELRTWLLNHKKNLDH